MVQLSENVTQEDSGGIDYNTIDSEERKKRMINQTFDSMNDQYVYASYAEFFIQEIARINENHYTPNPIECELYIKGVKKDPTELEMGRKRYKVNCTYGSDGYVNKVTLTMD